MSSESRDWNHKIVRTWDSISEGEMIQVLFMTRGEAESFRTNLHHYKSKIDDAISSYDDDYKKMVLSFEKISKDSFLYVVKLKEPKPKSELKLMRFNKLTEAWEELPDE